ncbi:MAG: asparagine synthase (glutamine-hydrolyzing), partial [Aridibacter sp.]
MCGIVGFVNTGAKAVSREVVEKMNKCIVHRGPDEDGFYVKDNVALAMRRLSIIDLAEGQQPIFNEDKTKLIV